MNWRLCAVVTKKNCLIVSKTTTGCCNHIIISLHHNSIVLREFVCIFIFFHKLLQQAEVIFCTCNRWRKKINFMKTSPTKCNIAKINAFSIIGVIIMAHYFQLKLPLADITLPINTIFSLISQCCRCVYGRLVFV